MSGKDESIAEILKGLEGLIVLNQWELILAKDLRQKAQALAGGKKAADGASGEPVPGGLE